MIFCKFIENTRSIYGDHFRWSNALPNVFAWKFPGSELTTKSQLIVSESQEAVFLKEGQIVGVFGPGRHTLDTKNYPFLTKLVTGLISDGETPFTAEVWFIQKAIPLNVKWGTATPMQIEDPQYHVMLPVRAFGQYGVQITDSQKFLCKLVGRIPVFTERTLADYFRGIFITRSKNCIAQYMVRKQTSLLHISADLSEISDELNALLSKEVETYGLRVVSFMVNSISVPENDPTVIKLRDAMAKRAEMNIVGYTYQQERSFRVMDKAAENEGNGDFIHAGMGMGMGMGMGVPMGGVMGGFASQMAQNVTSAPVEKICPKCSQKVAANMAFCPHCGNSMHEKEMQTCPKCGAKSPRGMKFCASCGEKLIRVCTGCGKELAPGAKFCAECGTKVEA